MIVWVVGLDCVEYGHDRYGAMKMQGERLWTVESVFLFGGGELSEPRGFFVFWEFVIIFIRHGWERVEGGQFRR